MKHVLGQWEEAGVPEKTHTWMRRTCIPYKGKDPARAFSLGGRSSNHYTTVQTINIHKGHKEKVLESPVFRSMSLFMQRQNPGGFAVVVELNQMLQNRTWP